MTDFSEVKDGTPIEYFQNKIWKDGVKIGSKLFQILIIDENGDESWCNQDDVRLTIHNCNECQHSKKTITSKQNGNVTEYICKKSLVQIQDGKNIPKDCPEKVNVFNKLSGQYIVESNYYYNTYLNGDVYLFAKKDNKLIFFTDFINGVRNCFIVDEYGYDDRGIKIIKEVK